MIDIGELGPGEIGFLTGSIKEVADTRVGDTITDDRRRAAEPLPGFRPAQPVVFCGLFPVDAADFENLRAAIGKLRLNDASFSYEMETSAALGFGFRCGFLGLLHLEIIQERLDPRVRPRPDRHRPLRHLPDPADRRHRDRAAQPGGHAGPGADRGDARAVDPRHDPHPGRASRRDPQALPGPARHPGRPLLCRQPRHAAVRPAAQRGGLRLLRPAEDASPRATPASTTTSPATARATSSRCRSSSTPSRSTRSRCSSTAARRRSAAACWCEKLKELIPQHLFKIPHPGGDRRQGHRARDDLGAPQGRHRQVLRRRRHAQAQAPRQAEGGEEEDAPVRQGRHPAGGLHRRAPHGGVKRAIPCGDARDEAIAIADCRPFSFPRACSMSNTPRTGEPLCEQGVEPTEQGHPRPARRST